MRWVLINLIRLYRAIASPLWHGLMGPQAGCRFTPTCSEYAIEAIKKHGVGKGSWMAIKRVGKCHPGHPGGADPVV